MLAGHIDDGTPSWRSWPLILGWRTVLNLHFAIDAAYLAPYVPFDLDLYDGQPYLSVVFLQQTGMRTNIGGIPLPTTRYRFCNFRTYVRYRGEPGIYFLAEYLDSAPNIALARLAYGLPTRYSRIALQHDQHTGSLTGEAQTAEARFLCHTTVPGAASCAPAAPGSLTAFCLERYTSFVSRPFGPLRFRITHHPWVLCPVKVEIADDSLLSRAGFPSHRLRLAAAGYSPGIDEVGLGLPQLL